MRFDTVIIGGGLSGLACGIRLAEAGKKCAIVSSGQGALHFFSGSFDLLGYNNGEEVKSPIEAMKSLSPEHPYSLVGVENVKALSDEVPGFFDEMGINLVGDNNSNHYRFTPVGNMRPTWLTADEYVTMQNNEYFQGLKVLVLNIKGYLDFPVKFITAGVEKHRVITCDVVNISIPQLDARRENASEMRSVNIAKVIESAGIDDIAEIVDYHAEGYDIVLLPAVFGWNNGEIVKELQKRVKTPMKLVATLPPSVPGVRIQTLLRKRFQALGGTILLGDTVEGGKLENGTVKWVTTHNLEDEKLIADNFVLATGNFFSHGLAGAPNEVYEPIFGLDVNAPKNRGEWYDERFFNAQPYMRFGVATDETFRARKDGKPVENLYVAGSVLGGADQIKEASMGGVSLITGLHVAKLINK